MKKVLASLLILGFLAACNNEAGNAGDKVDSLNERKDTLLQNVDSTADAKIDSIKNKSEELKNKFDSSIEAKKDSIKH
jgi:hypothetical protein